MTAMSTVRSSITRRRSPVRKSSETRAAADAHLAALEAEVAWFRMGKHYQELQAAKAQLAAQETEDSDRLGAALVALRKCEEALDGVLGWYGLGDVAHLMSGMGEQSQYSRTLGDGRSALTLCRDILADRPNAEGGAK